MSAFRRGTARRNFSRTCSPFWKTRLPKLAIPPSWPEFSPEVMRDIASIQEAVLIEKEGSKGKAGNPTVVARANLLREDVWNRWRAGQGLAPAGRR